jgi:ribonuclease Y
MTLIYILIGLVAGGLVGYIIRQVMASKNVASAEGRAEKILEDAKNQSKELVLEAKSQALEITEGAKKAEKDFRDQILRFEERIDRREKDLDVKSKNIEAQKAELDKKNEEIKNSYEEVKQIRAKQLENLEKISQMTKEEASQVLLNNAERGIKEEMIKLHRKLLANARDEAVKSAALKSSAKR